MRTYSDIWDSPIDGSEKLNFFYTLVVPILTYAAFTYPDTWHCRRSLHTTCNALLRRALNIRIRWDDLAEHVHTERLYDRMPTLPALMAYQFIQAFGHWVRHQDDMIGVLVLGSSAGARNRSGPPPRGPAQVLERLTDLTIADLTDVAPDRRRFRALARSAASRVEADMYERHIFKHRLGGPPTVEEQGVLMSYVRAKLNTWLDTRPN